MTLDTSYRARRLEQRMNDAEYRAAYEHASREIAQIDAVMRMLDKLRADAGMSKAQLAREIDKNPASVRRLFTSEVNPELKTVVAIADVLGAEIIVRKRPSRPRRVSSRRTPAAAH